MPSYFNSLCYFCKRSNINLKLIEDEIENLIKNRKFIDHVDKIITIAKYINPNLIDKIETILISKEVNINPVYFNGFMSKIKEEQEDFTQAINYFEKRYSYLPFDENYFNRKSFLLLKNKDYEKLDDLLNNFKSGNFYFNCNVLTINVMYSYKISGSNKYSESTLNSIISKEKSKDKLVSIAAKLVVGNNRHQALSEIRKLVSTDREYYLVFDDWVILENEDKTSLKEIIVS